VFTSPERRFFKPDPLRGSSNPLNSRASNIRTKTAVVRLRQRKWAERDEKRPEVGLSRGPGGSDNSPGMAAFCGVPTADQERKKNVPNGRLGGGRGIRTLGTIVASEALSPARRRLPCSTRAAEVDAPKRSRSLPQTKGICRAHPGHTTAPAQSVRNPTRSAACNKGHGASRKPRGATVRASGRRRIVTAPR
jgi:hypothetical protein